MSLFITFEGGEGSGKTTIAKMLHKQFIEEGYNITFSREPGGVDIAEQIRDVITLCGKQKTASSRKSTSCIKGRWYCDMRSFY